MHDTFLNQNLYESIVNLCEEHLISKIHNLVITVHTHSHINEHSIREYFADRNNLLIDVESHITIQKQEIEPLTATIEQIDGEGFNE
jgi:Zn finger protein HypA/HybF involved in hydrogenase expression